MIAFTRTPGTSCASSMKLRPLIGKSFTSSGVIFPATVDEAVSTATSSARTITESFVLASGSVVSISGVWPPASSPCLNRCEAFGRHGHDIIACAQRRKQIRAGIRRLRCKDSAAHLPDLHRCACDYRDPRIRHTSGDSGLLCPTSVLPPPWTVPCSTRPFTRPGRQAIPPDQRTIGK